MDQFNTQSQNQQMNNSQQGQQQQQPGARPTWQESLQQINQILLPVQEAVIVFNPHPTYDMLAASIALSSSLRKIGRKCHLVAPAEFDPQSIINSPAITQQSTDLLDLSQIINFLPQKQLRLVIDYVNGSFSKGSIKKSPEGLLLTLMPEANQSPIEPLNMVTQLVESKPDVLFTIGVENLFNLGDFYNNNQTFFSKVPIVNIDLHNTNAYYGRANLIDPKATSLCEMVTLMLYDLRFVFDPEMAKLLYEGIKVTTNNFAANYFSANMLEASSICLRYEKQLSSPQPAQ